MVRALLCLLLLGGCGGLSWNTTVADHPQVRQAMLESVQPGITTEQSFALRWGHPTQKLREGAQVSYIYRNMANPEEYALPQFGNSRDYVVVLFQYGLAVGAYSSDNEGCRATFAPRPPGPFWDNPTTVHTVHCGVRYTGSGERRPIAEGINWLERQIASVGGTPPPKVTGNAPAMNDAGKPEMPDTDIPMVPADTYTGDDLK